MLTCAETCFRHSLQCMRLHVGMSPWSQIPWTFLLYNVLVFKPQAASAGLLCFVMLLLKLTLTCSVVVAIYLAQTEILACKAAAAQRLAHVLLPAAPPTLCASAQHDAASTLFRHDWYDAALSSNIKYRKNQLSPLYWPIFIFIFLSSSPTFLSLIHVWVVGSAV